MAHPPKKLLECYPRAEIGGTYRSGNFDRPDERKNRGQASAIGEVSSCDALTWMTAVVSRHAALGAVRGVGQHFSAYGGPNTDLHR